MSASRRCWWQIWTATALAACGLTSVPVGAAAATGLIRAAQPTDRYNVGATHSPQLLRQLAGPMRSSGTASDGPGRSAMAGSGALAGAEQGVDVAGYQHPGGAAIDWSAVANAGIGFAAVKATEGAYYQNPYALSDLAEAKAAGLSVAAYAFAIPDGNGASSNPVLQADDLISYLGPLSTSVPIMLDVEYNPYSGGECYGLGAASMVSWIAGFSAEVVAKTGRSPIVYTPAQWWDTCTGGSGAFRQDSLWLPDYTSASSPALPAGWANWSIWQYSSVGTVSGIPAPGNTDLDQLHPGLAALPGPAG